MSTVSAVSTTGKRTRPGGVEPPTSGSEVPGGSARKTGTPDNVRPSVAPTPTKETPKRGVSRTSIYTRIYTLALHAPTLLW